MRLKCAIALVLLATVATSWSQDVSEGRKSSVKAPIGKLGQLEVCVTRVKQWAMIADSFTGPSTYERFAQVNLRITNVGNFPVCARIRPSVEQYEDSEISDTQPIESVNVHAPKMDHLAPGGNATGYYSFKFKPASAKSRYVLVLEQLNRSQGCDEQRKDKNTFVSGDKSIRLPLAIGGS